MLLKAQSYYKENKHSFPEPLRIRLHRALSWLNKASECYKNKEDLDFAFISSWIAFNAIYGRDLSGSLKEGDKLRLKTFLYQICSLDEDNALSDIVWVKFSQCINMLMKNKYTYQKFWDFVNGVEEAKNWEETFESINKAALRYISFQKTEDLLSIVFDRLYTIRNQLVHGGSTYGSGKNRTQIDDGTEFLLEIIPQMLIIMMKNKDKNENWGKPFYPPMD